MKPKKITILKGNVLDRLKDLPDNSIHCCVCSPPYFGLRVYSGLEPVVWDGKEDCDHNWMGEEKFGSSQTCSKCFAWRGHLGLEPTPQLYVHHLVNIFREVKRVLRPDGTFWLNIGDSYAGSGKAGNNPEYQKKHTQFGRKERKERLGRVFPIPKGLKAKDIIGVPWLLAFALRDDGWWLRRDIIWAKSSASPENVHDRPSTTHEYIFLLTKSKNYFYDSDAVRKPYSPVTIQRNHYVMNKFGGEKADPLSKMGKGTTKKVFTKLDTEKGGNLGSVWTLKTACTYRGAHTATFPTDLPEWCIRLGTSNKGCCPLCGSNWIEIENKWKQSCTCEEHDPVPCTVLDPFLGSGTTAIVAAGLDRNCMGVELSDEYLENQIQKRIKDEAFGLFVGTDIELEIK